MAKTLTQFLTDLRGYLAKGKVKAAHKTLEKAKKAGHSGPQLEEAVFELLLAEGGGAVAAEQLRSIARSAESRLSAAVKHGEAHLRRNKDDHAVRDAVWEACLGLGEYEAALKHVQALHGAGAVDGATRAKGLLERKDAAGAGGLFMLASVGALKTDRIKLADRMLGNAQATQVLAGVVRTLHAQGIHDGAVHYVLAQLANKEGDKERFLEHAGAAFEENPDEVWTWTLENVAAKDRLEIALRNGSLRHLLEAAGSAKPAEVVDVAQKSASETPAGKALKGLALLLSNKAPNACRILEGLVAEEAETAAPLAGLLEKKLAAWDGAREVLGAVVATGLGDDAARVAGAVDAVLEVPADRREEAWGRVAPLLLKRAPDRADLREALGLHLLGLEQDEEAAALLTGPEHLPAARAWASAGAASAPVLLAAATLAEEEGTIADHAEWLLGAATGDPELLGELGRRLSGATVSIDTALQSAKTLLDKGQKKEAAELLSRLPLEREGHQRVDDLLKEQRLQDDRGFQVVSFRCGLALGDTARAKRLFKGVPGNVQALAGEAAAHGDAARVLADVLIGQDKGEVAATLLEARRKAGDDARTLLPLADALLKSKPALAMARLLRARLLGAAGRPADAVRDLRSIAPNAAEVDEAFELLGELKAEDATGAATLGRADIHLGRKDFGKAVGELEDTRAPAQERLARFEAICKERPGFDAGHRGRAGCLLELKRIPEAADAHLRRFGCGDADPAAVAGDLEEVARASLKTGDLKTAAHVLEHLPEHVSDGAERAIAVIADDRRPDMLILKSNLLLQLQRTDEAVKTLSDLVATDQASRPKAAKALTAIIEAGQARPEADFALADTWNALERTPEALAALQRLYKDDLTGKEKVVRAAEQIVRRQDDPDVRLFLARIGLDMRKPAVATEHAVGARRLRPAARRDCVDVLRRALDLDAFAPETHFALAEAHLAGDEADDAVRHFRAAVEVDRPRAPAAIRVMEEAAPRSQNPSLLWLAVGTTYAEFQRDHGSAVDAFTKGLESNPRAELRVPLLLGRGDAYAALQEDDKAFDDFDEAAQHDLLERRYYEFLRARHRKRVLEAAETSRAKATESFAHAADAVSRFIRLGKAQEAVSVAQAALAGAPHETGPRYLVGVALHAAGRYDAAAQVLEMVRAAAGADTELGRAARMMLAESYLDGGDRPRARACLTEIESVNAAYPGLEARRAALAPPADDPNAPPPLFLRPEFPRPTE